MALIELSHATKAYWTDRSKRRARIVLDDVDLAIEEGEFNALIEDIMQKPIDEIKELYNHRDIEK